MWILWSLRDDGLGAWTDSVLYTESSRLSVDSKYKRVYSCVQDHIQWLELCWIDDKRSSKVIVYGRDSIARASRRW
jgi:hypothetical protein